MTRDKLGEAKAWLTQPSRLDKTAMVEALKGVSDDVLVKAYDIWWTTYSGGIQRAPSNRKIDGIQQGVREKDATEAAHSATTAVWRYLEKLSAAEDEAKESERQKSARPAEHTLIGVDHRGMGVYQRADGYVTKFATSDMTASARISNMLDEIEEEIPRLRTALMRRFRTFDTRSKTGILSHKAMVELQGALRVLHEAARALGETPQARAEARKTVELNRVWSRAKDQYQRWAGSRRKDPLKIIPPWHTLSEEQKAEWFALADDRVPPTWRDLTPEERGVYRDAHDLRTLPAAEAAAHHERNRQKNLRRKAYRQIEHANPYTVRSPQQRMADAAQFAQLLSYKRDEHARGLINDLELAVWAEHYRRAYHAYTRPFEPYPEP